MIAVVTPIIKIVGYFGPIIIFLLSVILLVSRKLHTLAVVYVVGFGINSILNLILKGVIQQPRPSENKYLFHLEKITDRFISVDRYGMPSGHAQSILYSTIFIWLSLKNNLITFLYILLSLNTLYQRVKYKKHTVLQVIIGAIVGLLMGYGAFLFSQKNLKGIMKSKADDNAPF